MVLKNIINGKMTFICRMIKVKWTLVLDALNKWGFYDVSVFPEYKLYQRERESHSLHIRHREMEVSTTVFDDVCKLK